MLFIVQICINDFLHRVEIVFEQMPHLTLSALQVNWSSLICFLVDIPGGSAFTLIASEGNLHSSSSCAPRILIYDPDRHTYQLKPQGWCSPLRVCNILSPGAYPSISFFVNFSKGELPRCLVSVIAKLVSCTSHTRTLVNTDEMHLSMRISTHGTINTDCAINWSYIAHV